MKKKKVIIIEKGTPAPVLQLLVGQMFAKQVEADILNAPPGLDLDALADLVKHGLTEIIELTPGGLPVILGEFPAVFGESLDDLDLVLTKLTESVDDMVISFDAVQAKGKKKTKEFKRLHYPRK